MACVWICVRVCVFCKRNATVVGEAAGILIGGGGGVCRESGREEMLAMILC